MAAEEADSIISPTLNLSTKRRAKAEAVTEVTAVKEATEVVDLEEELAAARTSTLLRQLVNRLLHLETVNKRESSLKGLLSRSRRSTAVSLKSS